MEKPLSGNKIIYNDSLRQGYVQLLIYLTVSSIAQFIPLAAYRVYESAFSCRYRDVNIVSLYAPFGFVALSALPMLTQSNRTILCTGGIAALVGHILLFIPAS